MGIDVGAVFEGTVTGITKFGAFVSLPEGKSGLVHISEVANTYVSDVHEFLQTGQKVKVKVLCIAEDGKINLSVKRAAEPPVRPEMRRHAQTNAAPPRPQARPVPPPAEATSDQAFEDRLKKFMQESDSRIADNRMYADRPRKTNRRK